MMNRNAPVKTHLLPCGVTVDRIASMRFDVVIAGGGAAGASCALAASARGLRVALVAKAAAQDSNTSWARGGVAAVLGEDDSFEQHIADTLECGGVLCDPIAVDTVVRGGPAAIERLLTLGAPFDRGVTGEIELGREGGHQRRRIVHAQGDATGPIVQDALSRGVEMSDTITRFDNAFALDVLTNPDGAACGLLVVIEEGLVVALEAPSTVLATGGAGQLFRETTNPMLATGDGLAMGLRAGALVRNMEFFQFHPTCLYIAGAARVLVSEIVRGAGGVLRDRGGDRFMVHAHRDADLAPRDVISRAITQRLADLGDTHVFLDLSEVHGDPHALFPGVSRTCSAFGIDIAIDLVPVRPGAHYMIGGLKTDLAGRTSVPGLWAIGECASTGLHGANRMGSNSLLEAMVIGHRSGEQVGAVEGFSSDWACPPTGSNAVVRLNLTDLTYSLKSLMWRQVGVQRSAQTLESALAQLDFWSRVTDDMAPAERRGWELRNMLLLAKVITVSALARQESRRAHFRTDFPDTLPKACHTDLLWQPENLGHLSLAQPEVAFKG